MNARTQILGRLRAHTPRAAQTLPSTTAGPLACPAPRPVEMCLQRFEIEAAALGVECFVEHTPEAVRARIGTLVNGRRTLSWHPEHLPYNAALTVPDALHAHAPRSEQASAEIGLTGCDAAVAETASLVMFSRRGRARAISLLPPFHLAIVERRQLCFSMAEVFATFLEPFRDAASCTIITGPSRTADIELTLTLGIHGPGRVAVIIGP